MRAADSRAGVMQPTSAAQVVALFGGSFNPPHVAHVLAVAWALSAGGADKVWVIPTGGHPFGKPLAPFEDRMELCRRAFACFGDRVDILDVEREPRVHFSVETVERLRQQHPNVEFRWLMGSDALAQTDQWRQFDRLKRLAPPMVIGRRGFPLPEDATPPAAPDPTADARPSLMLPDLSSTMIRSWLAGGPSERTRLEGLLPAAVLRYIDERQLYGKPR